jgi:septum formation protein
MSTPRKTQPGPGLVYLASRSPRRRELLAQLGLEAEVLDVEVDETPLPGENAAALVLRLAQAKAQAARLPGRHHGTGPPPTVIAADTAVTLDGEIFGKPADLADAQRILGRLAGRTHEVVTGLAVLHAGRCQATLSRSEVSMRAISADEITRYWHSGEPADKAGSYAIQGLGVIFIAGLSGSYSGVMGLPLYELAGMLAGCGYHLPADGY